MSAYSFCTCVNKKIDKFICKNCDKPLHLVLSDIGCHKTKYGTFTETPKSFLSVTTVRPATYGHGGAYYGPEFVGLKAIRSVPEPPPDRVYSWEPVPELSVGNHSMNRTHLELYACRLGEFPNSTDEPINVHSPPKGNALLLEMKQSIDLTEILERIRSGLIIDMGHSEIRFYPVHNWSMLTKSTCFGGFELSQCLSKLMALNGREPKHLKHGGLLFPSVIKDAHCEIAVDLNKTLELNGYQNWKMSLNKLSQDTDTYLSLLPRDLVTAIGKIIDMESRSSQGLERLGWLNIAPEQLIKQKFLRFDYEIGVERFIAMEALFTPSLIKKKDGFVSNIKAIYKNNTDLEKKIILCGGMATCPGLVERMKKDPFFASFKIEVEEHYLWQEAANILMERCYLK